MCGYVRVQNAKCPRPFSVFERVPLLSGLTLGKVRPHNVDHTSILDSVCAVCELFFSDIQLSFKLMQYCDFTICMSLLVVVT